MLLPGAPRAGYLQEHKIRVRRTEVFTMPLNRTLLFTKAQHMQRSEIPVDPPYFLSSSSVFLI